MSSRRFEGWREALDALGEYIGEGRREVLRAEAMRLDLLDWKEMGRKLDEMGRSPRMALFCLHRGGSSWGDGWNALYFSLPETWAVTPEEWRLSHV